ncbi:MAG: hypothetical protein DYG89_22325 [Caldilinea sp. CFX5]|nr:hypothetical protein [Caldilinea sp. CFX5]
MEQPFDDSAKNFYQRFFTDLGMRTTTQYEVFSRSRAIDILVECAIEDLPKLHDTVFNHFRRVNVLELKGSHDPLTASDFNLIMMRAWGLGVNDKTKASSETNGNNALDSASDDENEIEEVDAVYLTPKQRAEAPSQRTITIVCVTRPRRVLNTLHPEFRFEPTAEAGIYCNNDHRIPVWIIHPSELALKPANYPLLPLARGPKLEQFIELCVTEGLVDYLQLTLDIGVSIDPNTVWRKIMEVMNMTVTIREDTWPYIDEFFQKVPEAFQKLPKLREAVDKHAQQVAAQATIEGEIQAQQKTLLLVLRHRFSKVPMHLVQQIETMRDRQVLNRWLEQALDAETIQQLNFTVAPQT